MEKVTVKQLFRDTAAYAGKQVALSGWIRSNRDQKSFGFIALNDGTHFNSLQVVYEKEFLPNFDQVAKLGVGSAVSITGQLLLTPEARQPFEIKAAEITLEGDSPADYPIQPKRHRDKPP